MKRHRKIALVATLAAIGALAVASVAFASTRPSATASALGAGAGPAVMSNPAAFNDMQKLRDEHQAEVNSWYDKYGNDQTSAAAQAALTKLRTEQAAEMQTLLKKYGVSVPTSALGAGPGHGYGAGMMNSWSSQSL